DISPQIVRVGELLNKDPNSAEAMFTLGFIHVTAGEFGDAARQSQRAEKRAIEEGNAELAQRAAAQNAIAQMKLGKRKEAKAIVDRILAAPKTPEIEAEALLVLGHLHAVSGDKKAAIDAYSRAAHAAPSASPLQRAAAELAGITMPTLVQEGNRTRALRAVQIVRPWRPIVTGRTNIDTLIRDPFVTKVVFSLDGKVVETVEKAPFSADLDFGATPRAQTLRVQAFGRDGIEIAQDTIVINERHDDFTVSLIEPLPQNGKKTRVAVNVNLPASARLSRIDVYWNETKKGELTQEPFAIELELPKTPGYVRTVAVLDDGRAAEDTAIVNLEGFTETVEVELVELYVRVQDKQKRTIPDLTAADFTILDGDAPQQLVHAEYVQRPPLLIGLAVDTSPSMVEEILDVQSTAIDFLKNAFENDARAFVVGFSETPVLLHETSDDLTSIVGELERLRIKGLRTALNDALTFSMLQFEGTKAKKVLVFVSDGVDQASRYSVDEVIALARRNGVAIYGIVINSGYKGLRYADGMLRHDIGKLTSETGGKSFYLTDGQNLDAVYKEIDADFGDQYLLSLRPTTRPRAGEWRALDIRVRRPDARVVGAGGYVAR
ncbi:MAG TPA: VWA domain-containing protein, partial [Thermoanaerobaculia bacterium]